MMSCPGHAELVRLLDGELTENRARAVREHVATCPACRGELDACEQLISRIATPVPASAGAAGRVLARLAAERVHPASRRRAAAWAAAGGALAVAVALVLVLHHAPTAAPAADPGQFSARGGASAHSFARDVDVAVYSTDAGLVRLHDGDTVSAATPYAVSYRNLGALAYFAVFAVDAAGDVHWIAPAYLTAGSDPSSLPLPPAASDVVLAKATVLDSLARGPLRVIALVTARPLHVSDVERLVHPVDAAALRRRWPDADIRSLTLELRP